MKQTEYEQKKRECWEEFRTHVVCGTDNPKGWVERVFDRAYALGKQTQTITQEEIEKAAEEYAIQKTAQYVPEAYGDIRHRRVAERFDSYDMEQAFEDGANFALGKQGKDADTVIQGWVAIDDAFNQCFLHTEKPIQKAQPIADTGDYDTVWDSKGKTYLLDAGLFPDMDSDSDPLEVELIIKRRKNG